MRQAEKVMSKKKSEDVSPAGGFDVALGGMLKGLGSLVEKLGELDDGDPLALIMDLATVRKIRKVL